MPIWFTSRDARVEQRWVKRFAAADWTVDFPRGAMASAVTDASERGLTVETHFLRKGDLIGLVYESEDRYAHPGRARETRRDYSHCKFGFRWRSTGLRPLDAVNGPTMTIEGRDEGGVSKSWFVRLWNYAVGNPTDAIITLDFDELNGGFNLEQEADPVWPKDIDRIFFSLVPPDYLAGSIELIGADASGRLVLSDIGCDASGSVIRAGDVWAPEHCFNACTAYDDMYQLSPAKVVRDVEGAGFRGTINHYVGMSHFPAVGIDGLVVPNRGMCAAALEWHREFVRAAKAGGFDVIWSLSYELLDAYCPAAWKQRAHDGEPAATAYDPPSALLSPANTEAMDWLGRVAAELVAISLEAGLAPQFQIGEPWWWIRSDGAICCYDDAARAALGGNPVVIGDIRTSLTATQKELLDQVGSLLAQSTARIFEAARTASPSVKTHLLAYLPSLLDPASPEVRRANLPIGWAKPHCDVFQVEDYTWVASESRSLRHQAYHMVEQRLGYGPADQHYFSGYVAAAELREQWRGIVAAAREAEGRGTAKVFIWAIPQWWRDGVTLFGEESQMQPFADVDFPISMGADVSVSPVYSTNVVTSASGHEYRNSNWAQARLRFDAGPGVLREEELGELLAFFRARRGPAVAFRFRDPFDHSSNGMTGLPGPADQPLGQGDGHQISFELIKRYNQGEKRRITRPVAGTVRVSLNGQQAESGWSLGDLGVIQFEQAPSSGVIVAAGYLFDVPVRFADDRLEVNRATFLAGEAPSVPLIEVREG